MLRERLGEYCSERETGEHCAGREIGGTLFGERDWGKYDERVGGTLY